MKAPEYAELFAEAQGDAGESLETVARRRAIEGWQAPVHYQGQLVGFRPRHSDTLPIFLMKGAKPEKYDDKVQQTPCGEPGAVNPGGRGGRLVPHAQAS
jgi:hypothetical protein